MTAPLTRKRVFEKIEEKNIIYTNQRLTAEKMKQSLEHLFVNSFNTLMASLYCVFAKMSEKFHRKIASKDCTRERKSFPKISQSLEKNTYSVLMLPRNLHFIFRYTVCTELKVK